MQAALTAARAMVAIPYKPTHCPQKQHQKLYSGAGRSTKFAPLRSNNVAVDYDSSTTSVFPAEACETVGGEACLADVFPEAKLKPEQKAKTTSSEEAVDRGYLDYTDPKTVLMDEACDVLGGEFCQPPYQQSQT